MAHYHWRGAGQTEEVSQSRSKAPEITELTNPSPPVEQELTRLYVCGVEGCEKKFKKPMIIARHFNSNHADLREDKDTWRDYYEEIWE